MSLALYLHLPYCARRCSYCDFNAYLNPGPALQEAYYRALVADIRAQERHRLGSVFLGGGTPSLTPPEWLERIMRAVRETFDLRPDVEITLEANPGTLRPGFLETARQQGINRLSLGVQSFDDRILAGIDRLHSAAQAVEAVRLARQAGFDNLNLDLMYGLPGQTTADWEATLRQALALRPEHLSTYALILEEGTPLHARVRRGEVVLPDEDQVADMDEVMEALLKPAGYRRYEISNWSLPKRRCRHNCHYWANRDYLGLGCGAVSYRNGWRFRRILHPVHYAAAIGQGRSPVVEAERLGTEAALTESLILGLRTVRGVHLGRLARRHGLPSSTRLIDAFDSVPRHLVRRRGPRVHLTRRGREIASEVFVQLLEAALTLEPPARG